MRLDLVVGPNGAGKSTFVAEIIAPLRPAVTFVNADVIAQMRWPDDPAAHAYDAAKVAAETREALIEGGVPFIAETVFSHPPKRELVERARSAGYTVALHVLLIPEELAVRRVAHRVAAGGHSVPENKVRSRCRRLWPLVADAMGLADVASVYDNSGFDGPVRVAAFAQGVATGPCHWPAWTPDVLQERWP